LTRTTEPTLASRGRMTAGKSGAGMSTRDLEDAEQPEGPNKAPKRAIPTAANPPGWRNRFMKVGRMSDSQSCPANRSTVGKGQTGVPTPGVDPRVLAVMLRPMDWQKTAALGVVGITLGCFVWARWAPRGWRRPLASRGGGCGCSGGSSSHKGAGLIVHGRRGERPQVILR
jgi:hypothetical protein